MPESTVRKSRVSFRIVGSGEFVVEHEDGTSPADVLKELVAEKKLSLVDLYLHGDEFEWKLEATDEPYTNHEKEHTFARSGNCVRCGRSWETVVTVNAPCVTQATDEFYPPELGGGPITEADKTLVCECGRRFSVESVYCICGRTSEQFERPL